MGERIHGLHIESAEGGDTWVYLGGGRPILKICYVYPGTFALHG